MAANNNKNHQKWKKKTKNNINNKSIKRLGKSKIMKNSKGYNIFWQHPNSQIHLQKAKKMGEILTRQTGTIHCKVPGVQAVISVESSQMKNLGSNTNSNWDNRKKRHTTRKDYVAKLDKMWYPHTKANDPGTIHCKAPWVETWIWVNHLSRSRHAETCIVHFFWLLLLLLVVGEREIWWKWAAVCVRKETRWKMAGNDLGGQTIFSIKPNDLFSVAISHALEQWRKQSGITRASFWMRMRREREPCTWRRAEIWTFHSSASKDSFWRCVNLQRHKCNANLVTRNLLLLRSKGFIYRPICLVLIRSARLGDYSL